MLTYWDTLSLPGRYHPAVMTYVLSMIFLGLAILLGFIAVFVPWAQKDIAVGSRAYAAPFKTCIANTFSTVNEQLCLDNDFIKKGGAPLTQGTVCAAYVLTAIAFVFISVIGGVFLLLLMLWMGYRLLNDQRPVKTAVAVQIGLLLELVTAILAWIFWLVYATNTCKPNSIFPINSYSYGFVLYIFVTLCAAVAFAAGFIGFLQLRRFQPIPETAKYFDNYNAYGGYADAYGYADPYAGAYAGVGAIPQEQVPYPSANPSLSQTPITYPGFPAYYQY
jgi:hypothetical protein